MPPSFPGPGFSLPAALLSVGKRAPKNGRGLKAGGVSS